MDPFLSVHIVTYNHKEFISKAIDSVLSQVVNFKFEIVIGDDFSTDGTREILNDYMKKHPEKIILNLLKRRGEGMIGRENYESTMNLCKGKYIAFLDGDDYWTDNHKLQMQVDFLETNGDFVMCHHDCLSDRTPGIELKKSFNKKKSITDFYDACQITIPFMSSVVIKKSALTYFDRSYWLKDLDLGDFVLWALATLKGKAYFLDREMAYYRVSSSGVTKSLNYYVHVKNRMKFAEKLLLSPFFFDRKFIKRFLCKYYFQFSGYCISKRNLSDSFKYLVKSIIKYFQSIFLSHNKYDWINRLKWKTMVHLYIVNLYQAIKIA